MNEEPGGDNDPAVLACDQLIREMETDEQLEDSHLSFFCVVILFRLPMYTICSPAGSHVCTSLGDSGS